jgi:flap endonuclease-1
MLLMGIKGLTKTIKSLAPSAIEHLSYQELAHNSPKGIYGVDVNIYLYPSQYDAAAKGKGSHIKTFLDMIVQWLSVGIKLVFIFDGKAPDEKINTVNDRREKTQQTYAELIQSINIISDQFGTECIDPTENTAAVKNIGQSLIDAGKGTPEQRTMLKNNLKKTIVVSNDKKQDLIKLFDMIKVPYMQAEYEADFLLASLYQNGDIDGVISEDLDMLTHGVGTLIKGLTDYSCRSKGMIYRLSLDIVLRESCLTRQQFIDFCILCGCDYCPTLSGVGAKYGLNYIRKYKNMNEIIKAMRNNDIKYRPDGCTIDKFEQQYQKASAIFTTHHQPEYSVDLRYGTIKDVLDITKWLSDVTNYKIETINTKMEILNPPTALPKTKIVAIIRKKD